MADDAFELNIRFDQDGRTAHAGATGVVCRGDDDDVDANIGASDAAVGAFGNVGIDYSSKTVLTLLSSIDNDDDDDDDDGDDDDNEDEDNNSANEVGDENDCGREMMEKDGGGEGEADTEEGGGRTRLGAGAGAGAVTAAVAVAGGEGGGEDENCQLQRTMVWKRKRRRRRKFNRELLDDLLLDCELADCGLFPRTFWMPAEGMKPRCALERMALEIFHHHVPPAERYPYDPHSSGAEWWVQIRPSPERTGRYSMLATDDHHNNNNNKNKDDMSKSGISFHWDKDEELRLLTGGSMHVHPHVSTVTYLTGLGAPTLCANWRIHNLSGEYVLPSPSPSSSCFLNDNGSNGRDTRDAAEAHECFISCPRLGKHLSFDGRFLHAAPPDLMPEGMFERQCDFDVVIGDDADKDNVVDGDGAGNDYGDIGDDNDDGKKTGKRLNRDAQNKAAQGVAQQGRRQRQQRQQQMIKILKRRHRRVTFLVNVWLNYKPLGVEPFPDGMIDKLSGGGAAAAAAVERAAVSEGEEKELEKEEMESSNCTRYLFPKIERKEKYNKRQKEGGGIPNANDDSADVVVMPLSRDVATRRVMMQFTTDGTFEFTWPLGGCESDDRICMRLPLATIREELETGGNVVVTWSGVGGEGQGGGGERGNEDDISATTGYPRLLKGTLVSPLALQSDDTIAESTT